MLATTRSDTGGTPTVLIENSLKENNYVLQIWLDENLQCTLSQQVL